LSVAGEKQLKLPSGLPHGLDVFCRDFARLAALGLISGYVMHDIRNALAVVSGHAQIIQIKGKRITHEDIARRMEQIIEQVERILTTINRVGSFTSRAKGDMAEVMPDNALINAVRALERRLENAGLKVVEECSFAERMIWCDASLFDFTLLQLLESCIPDRRCEGELKLKTSGGDRGWELRLNFRSTGDSDDLYSGFLKRAEGFGLVTVLLSLEPVKGELYLLSDPVDFGFRLFVPWDAG